MKVSGKLSYKSAIIVNDVFFKDIDELLREYFEKPKYSAQLINDDEVEFESVSELISYDNFSNRAIKTMRIGFIARLEKLSYDINSETDSNSTSSSFISCAEYLGFSKYSLNNSSMSLKNTSFTIIADLYDNFPLTFIYQHLFSFA